MTAPLAADGVSTAKCGRLKAILPRLGMLKLNGLEAAALTGREDPEQSADALLRAGVERVVISLGEKGVLCGQGRRLFYLRAPAVEVVDATGAGDSLMAALAVGLSAGLDLKDCAEMGVAAAAITLAHPGSVTEALRALAR